MKIIKSLLIFLVSTIVILVLSLELYYQYKIDEYQPKSIETEDQFNTTVHKIYWASENSNSQVEIERLSTTKVLFAYLSIIPSGNIREKMPKGISILFQAARHNSDTDKRRTLENHLYQIFNAIWLSQNFTTPEIINYVLGKSYYGHGNYGLNSASSYYYNKQVQELNKSEILSLVSLLKAPSRYNPVCNKEYFLKRSAWLSDQLTNNWPKEFPKNFFIMPTLSSNIEKGCKSN